MHCNDIVVPIENDYMQAHLFLIETTKPILQLTNL